MTGLTPWRARAASLSTPDAIPNPRARSDAMAEKQADDDDRSDGGGGPVRPAAPGRGPRPSAICSRPTRSRPPTRPNPASPSTTCFSWPAMWTTSRPKRPGEPGTPLPQLNYQNGDGNVLTSNQSDGVGALIRGFIDFPGRRPLADDRPVQRRRARPPGRRRSSSRIPACIPTSIAPNAEIDISQPGRYEIAVTYFERKNTATLQLYWQPPARASSRSCRRRRSATSNEAQARRRQDSSS